MGLHSQTTRLYEYGPSSRCFRFPGPTGLSPSLACRSKSTSGSQAVDRDSPPLQTTIRPAVTIASREISDLGMFPLRSPLLRESLLVSLPPLIDMLKFSGWVSLDLRPQKKMSSQRAAITLLPEKSHNRPCRLLSADKARAKHVGDAPMEHMVHIRGVCRTTRSALTPSTFHRPDNPDENNFLRKTTRPSAERAPSED